MNPKIAARFTDTDQGISLGEFFVTDQPCLGLIDDAVDFDHACLAAAFSAVEGERQAGSQPGAKNALVLGHVDRGSASDKGHLERSRHQRFLIAVKTRHRYSPAARTTMSRPRAMRPGLHQPRAKPPRQA